MSNPYRGSTGDLGYVSGSGRGSSNRWNTERLAEERDRVRFAERLQDRDSRFSRATGPSHLREREYDEIHERRGPRGFEEERFEERDYDRGPRFLQRERGPERELEREPERESRRTTITMERERERERDYDDSPPRSRATGRPVFLRRQSSLDTFDRKPMGRAPLVKYDIERERERDEYGPPSRYVDLRPAPLTPVPLPRSRGLPPPRRFAERDYYEDIKVAEPDFYGDDDFRGYPERIREREIVRRRRRSHSRSRSKESRSTRTTSVRSSSVSSSDSGTTISVGTHHSVRSEFPKKGKTRMPSRLVSKKAIIDLDYPFEEDGDTIIIQKALGRENIDEVIKLSEVYKSAEKKDTETTLTTYLVAPEAEMSGARSEGTVIEERTEVFNIPPPAPPSVHHMPPPTQYAPMPPPPMVHYPPPPPPQAVEIVHETKTVEHRAPSPAPSHVSHHSHHHSHQDPVIIESRPRSHSRDESVFYERREVIERTEPMPAGPLALAMPAERHGKVRAIHDEIRALEIEKRELEREAKANRRANRRAERLRHQGRASDGQLVRYEDEIVDDRDVTIVRRERILEPEGGVRIEKDRKAPPPKLVRAMLATLT